MDEHSFQPQTPFEGYVASKLENMEKRLDALPCTETFKRLNKCENDIANMKGETRMLGIVFGAISGFLTRVFIK